MNKSTFDTSVKPENLLAIVHGFKLPIIIS